MKKISKRVLSLLLAVVMVVGILPVMSFAAEGQSWTEVALADITSTDTVAIVMHASATDKDYVMRNNGGTQTWGPASVWDAANTSDTTWHWNVVAVDGGYGIYPAGTTATWLYCINDNNGLRVGTTEPVSVWSLDTSGYLKCKDTGGNTRYLGVYDNNNGNTSQVATPNFRAYKNTTGNTKNQTLKFYKLTSGDTTKTVATPVISPKSGVVNEKDVTVTITCTTEGATIYYTTDGTDPTTASTVYDAEAGLSITVDTSTVIKTFATKEGMTDSAGATATYTYQAPATKTAEKMPELPKDGDTVIIYNNSGNAMGSAASDKKLAGVAATVTDNKLTVSDEMAQLLVTVEDDKYIFTLDGKYLTSADTGNGLSFEETLTNCGRWTAEAAGDGAWYLKNVGANYNGNYNQAMEYYSGFTTYGIEETEAYQMQFFLVSAAGVLSNGDRVVIYNPGSGMALSSEATGTYYRKGVAVTPNGDGTVNAAEAVIWDVTVNAGGTYTFSHNGDKMSMNADRNSLPLNEVNDTWTIREATTANCYYLINANRSAYYVEWYANYTEFSTYTYNASNEAIYALQFLKPIEGDSDAGLPDVGDEVVIYNLSAEGVLAAQDDNADSPSITNAAAVIADGKATPENGGVIFTVEKNGEYYRFKNDTYGYLCSNGTGNNAFYQKDATEDADWTLAVQGNGYSMESRTAKFNGKYSQYLEYYAGAYKTYSMYNVTDYDIYTFQFYPVADGVVITGGIVNTPVVTFGTLPDAYVGMDYTLSFTVDAVFGVQDDLTVKLGDQTLDYTQTDGTYTVTIPAANISGGSLTITVAGEDTKGVNISGTATIAVKDEPVISNLTPTAGSQTGENKKPVISATITNAGDGASVTMTVNGLQVGSGYNTRTGVVSYTPANDLPDGRTTVTVTVTRADGKQVSKTWSFTVGTASYQLYFGQLHSHTQYSDGSGTLDSALNYVAGLPDSANVDFVAFTDHSNYFDKSGEANPEAALYDMNQATTYSQQTWAAYKNTVAAFNKEQNDVVAIAGFEMTWSGGPGHINTFNTPGIVSRNNTTLNNKTADAGMKAYYALLTQADGADSLSQFNHPGSTFGTFSDFAYWDPNIDSRMYMVEVGNGEGAINAGGYYPSYQYYTMALDKGWHLAPTNNQDNHKGKWGNANDARDVILTDDFSEEGIYQAIRELHMYASEDKNLEVTYTVNGEMMGAQLPDDTESLNIEVTVNDPDATDSIAKVEVIVNSGKVAYTWDNPTELASGMLTVTLDAKYSYYYIRVTEGDGDLAVTAPVWVGELLKLGISSFESGTAMPVTNEEVTLTTTLFNSETTDATVKSLTYSIGDTVIGTDTTPRAIPASGTLAVDWAYTPTDAKVVTVTVTAVIEQGGEEYTFTMDVELDVLDAEALVYIGIDASHHNEYVAGNYKDSMGNFSLLASEYSVRTVELETSAALVEACENADGKYKMIILTAPSRRDGSALRDPYDTYSDAEIQALVAFNRAGGTLVFTGWSDYYESYSTFPAADHMAAQQNKVLTALGSSLRISDDGVNDDSLNGGQTQRLYFNTYGDSFLTEGVEVDPDHPNDRLYTEVFSHYGGASIYVVDAGGNATSTVPATVSPVVYGHSSTYSKDSDSDGLGGSSVPKYAVSESDERLMMFATEQLDGRGLIVVSGAAFMSNFEVQATIEDSGSEKNYSNYKICENLVQYVNPVKITDIATVQAQTEAGYKYTIEGVVTSNASGYDKDTAFFDCIYVQDETGGICCFPVAGNYKIGDRVRVTGTTDFFQGEPELQVTSITKIGEAEPVKPTEITAKQLNDGDVTGMLVTVKGTVTKITMGDDNLPESIYVQDASGNIARIFIDGYITTSKTIENLKVGCSIEVTGLASYDNTYADTTAFPRIRIRDRDDIVCTAATTPVNPPVTPVTPSKPSKPTTPAKDELPFIDVRTSDWFYEDVEFVYNEGIMNGTSKNRFSPNAELTRGMVVTILYRMEDEPAAGKADMFGDVPSGQWYTKAVAWAADNGIVNGYPNGNFGPNDPITREQLAAILYRYTKFKGELVEPKRDYLRGFADVEDISDYAVSAMNWAVGEGLINGSGNKLLPKAHATRAQVAAIIHRYLE